MSCLKCKLEGKRKKVYRRSKLCQHHYEEAKAEKRMVLHPLRQYYYSLMARCYRPTRKEYKYYGARGYTVAEVWHSRDAFVTWGKKQGYIKGMKLKLQEGSKIYGPDTCNFE